MQPNMIICTEYSQNYLDVKQVPFLFAVEPDAKVLVLTHASFLNWTTLNREKTEKRRLIIKGIAWLISITYHL